MQVQPYLFFGGRCDEALKFYGNALGARVNFLARYRDAPPNPERPTPPEMADKVMHANFQIGDSVLMCSDGGCASGRQQAHDGYSLSLDPKTVEDGKRMFDALLADGGAVTMPFEKTFWALGFGMLRDKFGVHWMINVEDPDMKK
ncbi:VOC family protein [Burkholderia pseudomallei]|uniref:VOC family protein n=1 Tax=Burkholderia pseudomallei TaxID=28450 RepID=UPI001AAF06EF|nr:VOC family protein [Burkholderia pseudomallei]MBO2978434.1 VOC family protein [Burkholderia pseudomallei]